MFKFNGGAGAVLCDVCSVILKEPASRNDSKNPNGRAALMGLDRCADVSVCAENCIRRALVPKVPTSSALRAAFKTWLYIYAYSTTQVSGLEVLVPLGEYGKPV